MQIYIQPEKTMWPEIISRPALPKASLDSRIQQIVKDVQAGGDAALKSFAKQFDGATLSDIRVSETEVEEAGAKIPSALKSAIQQAAANIERFHQSQLTVPEKIETMPGVFCWRKSVGIERVGLYIPGGSAPLFSTVLMLGIPARLAGCAEVVLCTPPMADGSISAAILYAASMVGIKKIFKAGGAQAIAAMAYGTESVPAVFKIFGPGNQWVTAAKQWVQQDGIAIDMPAGPSEVCVLADETAVPEFIAADLLSQAEHGADSQTLLVCTQNEMAQKVQQALLVQLGALPRKDLAQQALNNSRAVVVASLEEGVALVNAYAPEHLIISCRNDEELAGQVTSAGSIFLGNYSPESVGDYASGTNHVLPTNGYARVYGGVSVDSFTKKITVQKLSREGLSNIAATVTEMADAEGLTAHARAVTIRLKNSS